MIIFATLVLSLLSFGQTVPGEKVPQGIFEYQLSSTGPNLYTLTARRLKTTNPDEHFEELDAFTIGQMAAKCHETDKDFSTLGGEEAPYFTYRKQNFECVERRKVKAFIFIPRSLCQELSHNEIVVYGCYWQEKSEYIRLVVLR